MKKLFITIALLLAVGTVNAEFSILNVDDNAVHVLKSQSDLTALLHNQEKHAVATSTTVVTLNNIQACVTLSSGLWFPTKDGALGILTDDQQLYLTQIIISFPAKDAGNSTAKVSLVVNIPETDYYIQTSKPLEEISFHLMDACTIKPIPEGDRIPFAVPSK